MLIDTRELARTARTLEGTLEVATMPRLASLLSSPEGWLRWQVSGERHTRPDGGHDDLMRVELAADVSMQCVRCLGDAPVVLRTARSFRMVDSEEEAEREDLEDPEFDVITGGSRFDLAELIEDEAIMALPSVGRHAQCELPLGGVVPADGLESAGPGADGPAEPREGSDVGEGDRIRPFAGLAELTKRRH